MGYVTNPPIITGGGGAETDPVATPLVNAHTAATTNVHGMTDTASLWHPFPWEPSNYYTPYGSTTTGIPPEATAEFAPIWIPSNASFDQIMVEVTSTPDPTETCRLGLYSADAYGKPSALLIEAGVVTVSTNGQKIIDFTATPFPFPAPGLYWTCAALQGASTARPTMRRKNTAMFPNNFLGTGFLGQNVAAGYVQSGVTGALPATAALTSSAAAAMAVSMRAV